MSCRLFTPFAASHPPLCARHCACLLPLAAFPFFNAHLRAVAHVALAVLQRCNLCTPQVAHTQPSQEFPTCLYPPLAVGNPLPSPLLAITNSQLRLANGLQLCRLTNLKSHKVRGRSCLKVGGGEWACRGVRDRRGRSVNVAKYLNSIWLHLSALQVELSRAGGDPL